MNLEALTAISPVDGRYRNKVQGLAPYFSEYGLIKYRLIVEVEYFIALCDYPLPPLKGVAEDHYKQLREIYKNFSVEDAQQIKDTEKITNHDVKAVEYFLKDKMAGMGLSEVSEFVHFGLTSQDINNTAFPMALKVAVESEYLPCLDKVVDKTNELAEKWQDIPMLARTHGQPASPTLLGKELRVFQERLQKQVAELRDIAFFGKFGGATGNFNAHHVAYPEIDWIDFANRFLKEHLGLERNQFTTQIDHYDDLSRLFDCIKRINTILIDYSRDIWQYISMNYFRQKINKDEVGSSAMPHKVNPIDFENAEGNLGIANALLEHLSAKLPVSRLQRDLTDSTVLRNTGMPVAHSFLALDSMLKGLNKLELNEAAIRDDLENHWAVVAEGIQTILRREGFAKPYEVLKDLTRGNEAITREKIQDFVEGLDIRETVKEELKNLTPFTYTGIKRAYSDPA